MAKILIAYHSRGGTTAKMAELIGAGAKDAGVQVTVQKVADTSPEDLLEADGVVIGSPTYYGSAAAPVRRLLDDSVKLHGKLEGKVAGAFASSANIGGGNETTILSILQSLLIHGMIVPGLAQGDHYGPVSIGAPDARVKRQCEEFGRKLALLTLRLTGSTKPDAR